MAFANMIRGGSRLLLRGVNLSGSDGGGTVYAFPTNGIVDYFVARGMSVIRVPFAMERLCPTPGGSFAEPYATYLGNVIAYAVSKGLSVVTDPHNFGRFAVGATISDSTISGGTTVIIGQDAAYTNAQFQNFHQRFAQRYSGPKIIYGLINEPHDEDDALLLATHNAGITGIRSTGATNLILVNGNAYGSYGWKVGDPNRTFMPQIVDSGHNWAVDLHHYLDAYAAGQSTTVIPTYMDNLTSFTTFARSAGLRAFMGEIGAGGDATSLAALTTVLVHVRANQDVWLGWTYWTAVQYQDSYNFQVLPTALSSPGNTTPLADKPQMAVLTAA